MIIESVTLSQREQEEGQERRTVWLFGCVKAAFVIQSL